MSEEAEVEAAQGPTPMTEMAKAFALMGRLAKLTTEVLDNIPASPSEDDKEARDELAQDLADVAEACADLRRRDEHGSEGEAGTGPGAVSA